MSNFQTLFTLKNNIFIKKKTVKTNRNVTIINVKEASFHFNKKILFNFLYFTIKILLWWFNAKSRPFTTRTDCFVFKKAGQKD